MALNILLLWDCLCVSSLSKFVVAVTKIVELVVFLCGGWGVVVRMYFSCILLVCVYVCAHTRAYTCMCVYGVVCDIGWRC